MEKLYVLVEKLSQAICAGEESVCAGGTAMCLVVLVFELLIQLPVVELLHSLGMLRLFFQQSTV